LALLLQTSPAGETVIECMPVSNLKGEFPMRTKLPYMKTLVWALWISLIPPASKAQSTQTDHEFPGKAVTLAAVGEADAALRAYKDTLLKYRGLPAVEATIGTDRDPILIGGLALVTVKGQLGMNPEKLDGTSLAIAFANVDAATVNASLTAGAAALNAATNGPRHRDTGRNLAAATDLIANAQKLRDASDHLWNVLEKYLKAVESRATEKPTPR
jgi:hypothetical protein